MAGTFYFVVDALATKPSIAQMKAGQDSGGAAGDDSGNGAIADPNIALLTGLVTATSYFLHCYEEGADGKESNIVTSAQFTMA